MARFLLNVVWYALQGVLSWFAEDSLFLHEGWPLKRHCRRCGCVFLGRLREPPNYNACARCDYNLTGNLSGRCPECGWKLPRRYRAYCRKVRTS